MYRVRPPKPVAIAGAVIGAGIIVFGVVQMGSKNIPFLLLWIAIGLFVIGFNLWAAFSKKGATQIVESDKTP